MDKEWEEFGNDEQRRLERGRKKVPTKLKSKNKTPERKDDESAKIIRTDKHNFDVLDVNNDDATVLVAPIADEESFVSEKTPEVELENPELKEDGLAQNDFNEKYKKILQQNLFDKKGNWMNVRRYNEETNKAVVAFGKKRDGSQYVKEIEIVELENEIKRYAASDKSKGQQLSDSLAETEPEMEIIGDENTKNEQSDKRAMEEMEKYFGADEYGVKNYDKNGVEIDNTPKARVMSIPEAVAGNAVEKISEELAEKQARDLWKKLILQVHPHFFYDVNVDNKSKDWQKKAREITSELQKIYQNKETDWNSKLGELKRLEEIIKNRNSEAVINVAKNQEVASNLNNGSKNNVELTQKVEEEKAKNASELREADILNDAEAILKKAEIVDSKELGKLKEEMEIAKQAWEKRDAEIKKYQKKFRFILFAKHDLDLVEAEKELRALGAAYYAARERYEEKIAKTDANAESAANITLDDVEVLSDDEVRKINDDMAVNDIEVLPTREDEIAVEKAEDFIKKVSSDSAKLTIRSENILKTYPEFKNIVDINEKIAEINENQKNGGADLLWDGDKRMGLLALKGIRDSFRKFYLERWMELLDFKDGFDPMILDMKASEYIANHYSQRDKVVGIFKILKSTMSNKELESGKLNPMPDETVAKWSRRLIGFMIRNK